MINPRSLKAFLMSDITDAYLQVDTEEEYHNYNAVGNSDLKKLEDHPKIFVDEVLKRDEEEDSYEDLNSYYKIGTMFEQRLLQLSRFNENFIQEPRDMKTPSSPNQKQFVESMLDGITAVEAYCEAYSTRNKSEEQIMSKSSDLYDSLKTYIDFKMQADGKGQYTADEAEVLNSMISSCIGHEKIHSLISSDNVDGSINDYERWVQLPVFGSYDGIMIKGLVDLVVYDKPSKTLMNIDIKTTSKNPKDFPYFYHRFKYHRQQGHYRRMLKPWADKIKGLDVDKIDTYCIVVRTKPPYDARLWKIHPNLLHQGTVEVNTLLNTLKWHIEEDKWEHRKSYYDHGVSTIELDENGLIPLRV